MKQTTKPKPLCQSESHPAEYECNACNKLICADCIAVDGVFDKHDKVYCESCRKKLHLLLEQNGFQSLIQHF